MPTEPNAVSAPKSIPDPVSHRRTGDKSENLIFRNFQNLFSKRNVSPKPFFPPGFSAFG